MTLSSIFEEAMLISASYSEDLSFSIGAAV